MFVTPIMRFGTMKLIVKSESILNATDYDPCPDNIPNSTNPISVDVPVQKYPQTAQN
jgi:hypothetical protein